MTKLIKPAFTILGISLLLLLLFWLSQVNHPAFHALISLFGVAVAWAVFMLVWNARSYFSNHYLLMIGIPLVYVGLLDMLHVLAYQTSLIFTEEPAISLWSAARYLQSVSMLVAGFFLYRRVTPPRSAAHLLLALYGFITAGILVGIFSGKLFSNLVTTVEARIENEYIISFAFMGALGLLLWHRHQFNPTVVRCLSFSIVSLILSGMSFTLTLSIQDFINLLGHAFRLLAYFLIYRAVIYIGLRNPFDLLLLDLKKSEADLHESQARLQAILDNTEQLFILLDRQGNILVFNQAANEAMLFLLGKPTRQNTHIKELLTAEHLERFEHYFQRALAGETISVETVLKNPDGLENWYIIRYTPIKDNQHQVTHVLMNAQDITERKKHEAHLQYMSTHDALTGLYNRLYFEEEMARLSKSRRSPISIIIMDMDNLKAVNDSMGHQKGDEILRITAGLLRSCFRTEDMIARIGGDEFVVLLPQTNEQCASQATQRLRQAIASYNLDHPELPLKISIGYATALQSNQLNEAFTNADNAMYAEKRYKQGMPAISDKK